MIALRRALAEDSPVIQSMMAVYLAEISAPPDYPYLPLYWTDERRYPYVIADVGTDIGFALVRSLVEREAVELAEFFIMSSHRNRGAGRTAVGLVMAQHQGPWEIYANPNRPSAVAFWTAVLPPLTERFDDVASGRVGFRVVKTMWGEPHQPRCRLP